ncbi:MAG: hypothetical protein KBT44_02780 [Bacteroidales bacterium]|nr:hypothetical protein [Candidatus Equibacterium intestinale]
MTVDSAFYAESDAVSVSCHSGCGPRIAEELVSCGCIAAAHDVAIAVAYFECVFVAGQESAGVACPRGTVVFAGIGIVLDIDFHVTDCLSCVRSGKCEFERAYADLADKPCDIDGDIGG